MLSDERKQDLICVYNLFIIVFFHPVMFLVWLLCRMNVRLGREVLPVVLPGGHFPYPIVKALKANLWFPNIEVYTYNCLNFTEAVLIGYLFKKEVPQDL